MPYKVSQDKEKPGPSEKKHSKASGGPSKPQMKSSKSVPSTSSSKTSKTTSSKDKTQNSKTKTSGKKNESVVSRKSLSRASSETAKKNIRESCEDSEDSHSEDEDKVEGKKRKKTVVPTKEAKKSLKTKKKDDEDHGKVLSASSSEAEDVINRSTISGHDFWLELYFPEKRRWICFDAFKGQFGKPYSLENTATQPLTYVVAFKNDGGVKDVTARYAKLWMSHTRKQRADSEWWEESLAPFNTTPHSANMEEDDEIKGQLLVRPMPTSIGDLKNHPLYALRRHLLKFEAIYPDTAMPLGYIKQEPIYARECVQTLHSRDNWLKEGRMVRLGEQPYKMVKSRPKWNKPKDNPDELDLELYGEWQTEKYIPPPAVNGKVPKNEYGNLELFKPWMLPLGTVQLKVNGLQRIARKLGIDVAPAMIGWDHHSGHAHPVFDGVVVCEEHADTLMVAWTEDQEIQEQREIEKVEKRVYGNWRLLIRGLLIKNRLAEKFSQVDLNVKDKKERLLKRVQELKKQEEQEEELTFTNAEPALDVQHSWPRRQQDEVKDRKAKDTKLKIEEARNLLEKGYRTDKAFDTKDEIAVQTKESKGPAGKSSNGTLSNTVKHNGNRKSTSGTKAQIFKKEGVGKPSKGVKDGANAVKRKNTKSPTVHRGKRSEESETEEEFSDEDGQSKPVVKSKMTNRPKRRSVAAVKYFDSDEDGEQIIDDSDADSDFEQVKEKPRGSAKKVRTNDDEVDGAMDNVTSTSGSSKKKEPETDETRHWLDEEGSSSDENDFISVEPGDFSHSQIVQEKEILIDLDENKNLSAKLTTPGKETSVSDDKFEPSEGIFKNNIEMVSGVGNELSKASEALAVSEETCAQKASFNNTNRRKNKKQTHEDAFNTQTTSSNNSLISKKERDGGPKLPDKMNITENSKTSNTGTSKGRQQKSKDSTKSEEKVETKVNRKSMRITRQTS
ncbi:hypothetical protein EGW08_015270 [Elysia chlorotica]|uniref:Rad4 beta-hairpin domain-containing protein n=1 Tax=Elysia chlorotica TaxID=188477 RepID=A0A3S0ZEB6_ELYCH|nr:hypothetical protein EGW08_015270 [Elysia chlorotica]